MKRVRDILPKGIGDIGATTFFILALPLIFFFELNYVLPYYHYPGTFWYYFHLITAFTIFTNIMSSYFATIFETTSIQGRLIPETSDSTFCTVCESFRPPRAWHCDYCKVCILKRDHHCIFTSCCIGYYNHRYFMMLLIYTSIGTLYATFYNVCFCYENYSFNDIATILRIIMPLFMFMFGKMTMQFSLLVTTVSVLGCLFANVLLFIHVRLVIKGAICYENNNNVKMYDYGLKENIIGVFGKRWYIAWLSPFIPSELPGDGIKFQDTTKNK